MSYLIKSTSPFVSIKLTQTGREMLAQGKLNFSYWAIGDSEINYERETIVDANQTNVTLSASSIVLRPVDREPNLKTFIFPNTSPEPLQTVDSSILKVVKAVVNNQATTRGFFSEASGVYTTQSSSTYIKYQQTISNSVVNGTSTLSLTSTAALSVGDVLLLKLSNNTLGNITSNENTRAMPNLWFKIQAIPGGTSVTLDRPLPNFTTMVANSQVIVYGGGEVYDVFGSGSTAYWDTGTLSFDSSNNVTCYAPPVWNMNNVWCENIAGVTGLTATTSLYENYTYFGSYPFLGTKYPYLEVACTTDDNTVTNNPCDESGISYLDSVSKSISVIHYTNNAISNVYGEFIYSDDALGRNLSIYLPDLMYHRRNGGTSGQTTMGMNFIASGTTKLIPSTDIEYLDLYEDSSMIVSGSTAKSVGKMYPQYKIVVVEDDEIVAATSYKSNRNWTLPELSANLSSPSGGTSTGVLNVGETMYLTYMLESTSGLTATLPCQKYIKITNTTASAKDVAFKINSTDLLPYMRKLETNYDGYGFFAHKFKLVYQIVSDKNTRPEAGSWKVYDFTSTAITTVAGQTINPKLLENQTPSVNGFLLTKLIDTAATKFSIISSLNLPLKANPTDLQFGDEKFFYGNLKTYIGATIYKTIFDVRVNADIFNTTTNPTRSTNTSTTLPNIKVSEVGIYDSDRNLVCIGKLSTPVSLKIGTTITFELSLDF